MRGHVLERRGHSHGRLERENLKKQEAAYGKKSFTAGMLNKTADGLFLEIKCGKLALGELRLKAEGSLGPRCVQIMCISRNMNKVSLNWSVSSFSFCQKAVKKKITKTNVV